jgi:hypothetical protein
VLNWRTELAVPVGRAPTLCNKVRLESKLCKDNNVTLK